MIRLIIVVLMMAILLPAQDKILYQNNDERTVTVDINNAIVNDKRAKGRDIKAIKNLKKNKLKDTLYFSIPIEPTITNSKNYEVIMIITTPEENPIKGE